MRSSWVIRRALNPMRSVFVRDTWRRDLGRRDGDVETRAEIGMTQPQGMSTATRIQKRK